jgi:hypothetical protein
MQTWLYQMRRAKAWRPEDYRMACWEGAKSALPAGGIVPRGLASIGPGDTLVLFFAKSFNDYPGIYGWGVVLNYEEQQNQITFQLAPPSDYLKMDPLWDAELHRLMDKIRGGLTKNKLWGISWEEFSVIRHKMRGRFGTSVGP